MATSPYSQPLCQFYVRSGHCRNGYACRFSHDMGDLNRAEALKTIPCPFYRKGTCRFGDECQLLHEVPAAAAAAPHKSTVSAADAAAPNEEEADHCQICFEPIERYGILSCCNHTFCFGCIMEWRTQGTEEVTSRRVCPTCRRTSDYVVSSRVLPKSDEEKQELFKNFRDRLGRLPCKHWLATLGSCPFGRDCFYAHLDDDGKDVKGRDRTMQQLYEERQRQRDDRREEELEIIMELIMMGMQRNLFGPSGGGNRRRRRGRGQRNRQDDEDGFNPFELLGDGDNFVNHLLNHFITEHRRHARGHGDGESEDGSGSDSSMPELENVPRQMQQQQQRGPFDDESVSSEWGSTDESEYGSIRGVF